MKEHFASKQLKTGMWAPWPPKILSIGCCDCGLVHDFQVKFRKGIPYFTVARNDELTLEIRKRRGIVLKPRKKAKQ